MGQGFCDRTALFKKNENVVRIGIIIDSLNSEVLNEFQASKARPVRYLSEEQAWINIIIIISRFVID